TGQTVGWGFSTVLYDPPSASKNVGQPFAFQKNERDDAGVKFQTVLTDYLTFRSGYKYIQWGGPGLFILNNGPQANGNYSQFTNHGARGLTKSENGFAYFDADFETGPLSHHITFGMNQNSSSVEGAINGSAIVTIPGFNFFNPSGNAAA